MKLIGILSRIVVLLEEQNKLLRELHLNMAGKWPQTAMPRPVDPTKKPRIRSAADVWVRPPLTEQEQDNRNRQERENAASSVVDSDGSITPSTDGPAPVIDPKPPSGTTLAETGNWPT